MWVWMHMLCGWNYRTRGWIECEQPWCQNEKSKPEHNKKCRCNQIVQQHFGHECLCHDVFALSSPSSNAIPRSVIIRFRKAAFFLSSASRVAAPGRSEERRVGTECVSPCISRWSPS